MPRRAVLRSAARAGTAAVAAPAVAWLAGCAGLARPTAAPLSAEQQLDMDSGAVLAAIRSGQLSAEAYMTTLLARAGQIDHLHAFIAVDRAGALVAARRVDALRARGAALPPLAGLPIVVKDNINTRDLPTTGGTPALRGVRPSANAPVLQKLIDAGAIVMAKTNLHELAFGITSSNLSAFAGPVRNPWDPTRIPGGSSGGTAAAIAARAAISGLGTDTGGSTRIPAALCGIVGLRPSVGNGGAERRYDVAGVVPISHTRDTIGPMGRTVADVALLDAVIAGGSPVEPASLAGVRIGVPAVLWAGLSTEVAPVMAAARRALEAAGVACVRVDIPDLLTLNERVSFPVALHEPIADIPAYLVATGVTGIGIAEIAAQIASPDVKGAFGAIQADAMGAAYLDAVGKHRLALQQAYARYFRHSGLEAIMFPTTIATAAPIDAVNGSAKFAFDGSEMVDTFQTFIRNTDPGSNAGLPGLSLPAGLSARALPVGLELDGPVGSDRRLLSLGMAFERVLGRLPAPPV